MSLNQRPDKSEPPQYRKTGRSVNSGSQRNFTGGSGKGGGGAGTGPPPFSSYNNSTLSSNRSFKNSNNAQGGQSRVSSGAVSSDSNDAAAASASASANAGQNGPHLQPPLHGSSDAPATVKPTDTSTQKSARGVPKAPAPAPAPNAFNLNPTMVPPSTPVKGAGGFSLQFGSLSPGFMNGMQLPARTSSAPPNLDEQKREQARHNSLRAPATLPTPTIPKQQLPTKSPGTADQSNAAETHPKAKRDIQVSMGPPTSQNQKPSGYPIPVIPMQVPFHQPQVQFGGPNPQLQSQGMVNTSLPIPIPMPMPMPMPMGNPSQVQHQFYVQGLQPHPIQSQGIMHQGQSMSYSSQMGPPKTPPQLGGNMGINITSHFPQQQAGKFGGPRKTTVKITHPDTHEVLRLDKRADAHDGGLHPSVPPQSQPITSFQPAHQINYYPNSFNSNTPFYPGPSSHPLTSSQITSSSQPPRFYNQVTVKPPANPRVDKGVESSLPSKPSVRSSDSPALVEHPTSTASNTFEGSKREILNRSDSIKHEQELAEKGHSQNQAGGQCTSSSTSTDGGIVETVKTIKSPPLSATVETALETTREPPAISSDFTPSSSNSKTDSAESSKTVLSDCAEISPDISLQNEKPKPEAMETEESGEITFPGDSKDESRRFENTPAIYLKSPESVDQTVNNPDLEVEMTSSEPGSLENTGQKLEEEPVVCCKESEGADDLPKSPLTSSAVDALISETSLLSLGLPKSPLGDEKSPIISTSSHPEATLTCEIEATDNNKPLLETNRATKNAAKGKKKRKEAIQKADRAGTTSDLYMAYKGPEEKNEETATPVDETTESTSTVISNKKIFADEEIATESKTELDDWEDAADMSSPKIESSDDVKQVGIEDGNSTAKKYSRDFLLKFSEQCADLPEGFEIPSDIAEVLIVSTGVPRESYPSRRRNVDRPLGRPQLDRRGSGLGDDQWSKVPPGGLASGRDLRLDIGYNIVGFRPGQGGSHGVLRNPRMQSPVQYPGGILSGQMQHMGAHGGGMYRNTVDSDRWQRATGFQRGLIPSPQTPLQAMHKAERKYIVGKITDEEQAKQRQLKGILNKLTPQNFDKLFEQVKQVNIDNAGTLNDVIAQIFDKALMEPTFCEMYANFCYHLAGELPDFTEDDEKITFKRVLLNKCQEEFERGVREQEEANRAEEDGEAKQTEEEREEKRIRARRRMLGNIRLIGELYKKKMLTERIMHECIKKLLGQNQNPDEEDVEALCKLMSTIGEMIDHPRAKEHMDRYFDMMAKLSNNMKLSSRVRFMLKDSIDLRKNKWQQRRKVEGPKKIEEVHRDAANERHAQTNRLARGGQSMGSSFRRGPQPAMDFGPRGSNILPSPNSQMGGYRGFPQQQPHGYGIQDARSDDRHNPFENRTLSVPLSQRPIGDDSITLGPQGGLARGMSIRGQPSMSNTHFTSGPNGYSSTPERPVYASREELNPRFVPDRFVSPAAHDQMGPMDRNMSYGSREVRNVDRNFDRSRPNTPPTQSIDSISMENVSSEEVLPEEHLRDMSLEAIKEFYSAKDEIEVALCVKDLKAPSFYPSMISIWITDSFERKDMERGLLAKLLVNLTKSQDAILTQDQLVTGFESVLTSLEDAATDAPKAPEFLGGIFAKVILENVVPMKEIGRLIYEGGEEQGRLVEIGLAAEVLGSVLEIIKSEKGDPVLNKIRMVSGLHLENFRPPNSKKTLRLDKFI